MSAKEDLYVAAGEPLGTHPYSEWLEGGKSTGGATPPQNTEYHRVCILSVWCSRILVGDRRQSFRWHKKSKTILKHDFLFDLAGIVGERNGPLLTRRGYCYGNLAWL